MTIRLVDERQEIALPVKTYEIIRRVIEISAEIERIPVGSVTFHFKGRSVKPHVSKHYRSSDAKETS